MDKSEDGILSREEFSKIYEFSDLNWKPVQTGGFQRQWVIFQGFGYHSQKFLNTPYADYIFSKFRIPLTK